MILIEVVFSDMEDQTHHLRLQMLVYSFESRVCVCVCVCVTSLIVAMLQVAIVLSNGPAGLPRHRATIRKIVCIKLESIHAQLVPGLS